MKIDLPRGSVLLLLFVQLLHLPGCKKTTVFGASQEKFSSCTACLAEEPARCATYRQQCGDLPSEDTARTGAMNKLCDSLPAKVVARRPTPTGYHRTPWTPNACYDWPPTAFRYKCTTFQKTCYSVPIH